MTKPCKFCGSTSHHAYQCYRNPRRGYNLKKRYEKAYKTGKVSKHDKVLDNQPIERKRLIMELDKYVSWIVRIGASDRSGCCYCYTCGRRLPWKAGDCSHYFSRQFMGTRFDFENVKFCCTECNRTKRGNLVEYRKRLVRDIGEEGIRRLEQNKNKKISTAELEELLEEMKKEYRDLVEEKRKSLCN